MQVLQVAEGLIVETKSTLETVHSNVNYFGYNFFMPPTDVPAEATAEVRWLSDS